MKVALETYIFERCLGDVYLRKMLLRDTYHREVSFSRDLSTYTLRFWPKAARNGAVSQKTKRGDQAAHARNHAACENKKRPCAISLTRICLGSL